MNRRIKKMGSARRGLRWVRCSRTRCSFADANGRQQLGFGIGRRRTLGGGTCTARRTPERDNLKILMFPGTLFILRTLKQATAESTPDRKAIKNSIGLTADPAGPASAAKNWGLVKSLSTMRHQPLPFGGLKLGMTLSCRLATQQNKRADESHWQASKKNALPVTKA